MPDGASLLQHETDHLDGILTLDRATPAERRRAIGALTARAA
jgi:peptide deformylase